MSICVARFIILKTTSVIKSIVYAALSLSLDHKNRQLQTKPRLWVPYQGLLINRFNNLLSETINVLGSIWEDRKVGKLLLPGH